MTPPPNHKNDLWAQFQEKTGAGRSVVTPRAVVTVLVVLLLVWIALALR